MNAVAQAGSSRDAPGCSLPASPCISTPKLVDTGECREIFGYTARRVITRTTYRSSPEGDSLPSETEADGWYIDAPSAWRAVTSPSSGHAYLHLSADGRIGRPVFTESGRRETGFCLLVTRTHRSGYRDAEGNVKAHTSVDRDEVTEFSEENLDPGLFVPPRDFRRVLRLPGEPPLQFTHRVRLQWEKVKDVFLAENWVRRDDR